MLGHASLEADEFTADYLWRYAWREPCEVQEWAREIEKSVYAWKFEVMKSSHGVPSSWGLVHVIPHLLIYAKSRELQTWAFKLHKMYRTCTVYSKQKIPVQETTEIHTSI